MTEYTGTVSIDKGMQYLSGSAKTALQKEVAAAGLSTATFTVWVDRQSVMRKAVITENGTALTEAVTVTVTTLNQPVRHPDPGRQPDHARCRAAISAASATAAGRSPAAGRDGYARAARRGRR